MIHENNQTQFHKELKELMDQYVHGIYDVTSTFPKNEVFGVISQMRRAALSIILNYIEGFARKHKNVLRNFLEICYGSLKETKYLLYFSYKRNYLPQDKYNKLLVKGDRIGKMVWGILEKM